jgi:predicted  nucleic acid-binding Zn-ribbon protein
MSDRTAPGEFAHVCRQCGWRGSRRHVLRFCPDCGGLEIFGVCAVPVGEPAANDPAPPLVHPPGAA